MTEKLGAAIDELVAKLETQMAQVSETKRTINTLRRYMGLEPMFEETDGDQLQIKLRPDQFYGKPLSTVVQEVLEKRAQPRTTDEILADMEDGGFDFRKLKWKEEDRARSLAITLSKNSKTFHRLPTGHFGLLSWYPDVYQEKSNGRGSDESKDNATAVEEETKNPPPVATDGG